MPRYRTRAGYFDASHEWQIHQPEPAAIVDDGLVKTGLLDARGDPIYRTERGQLGFDLTPRRRVRVPASTRRV